MSVFDKINLLSVLLVVPVVGAFAVVSISRTKPALIRSVAVGFAIVEFLLSLLLLRQDYSTAGYLLVENIPWVESLGISYKIGVDGISLWLVLLTTLLTPIALSISWSSIDTKIKEYALSFLLLELGMLGAFIALDVFLFYVFWEIMLIPMYLIIGIWGGPRRVYAAVKFFLYTMVGSLLMLVAILYLVSSYHDVTGVYTFDLEQLTQLVIPRVAQYLMFAAFGLAFAIKVPMFPFHTWLPDAHVEAPTGGSVILAAVLLKLGTYGFIRFGMPLFPLASVSFGPAIATLGIIGIIYGAYVAWVQRDLKKLIAYSSVSHMGFIALGMFAMNQQGLSGSILQMINHGVSTGALFILVGVIYERRHTRDIDNFGGLAAVMPWYATVFVIVTMSSIGLPGTNGFVGEFMILSGAFLSQSKVGYGDAWLVFTLLAATGVIFAAVYMLHAVLRLFWGKVVSEENKNLADLNAREATALAPLVLLIFAIGLYPSFFLSRMDPSVSAYLQDFDKRYQVAQRNDKPRLVTSNPPTPARKELAVGRRGDARSGARQVGTDGSLAALAPAGAGLGVIR